MGAFQKFNPVQHLRMNGKASCNLCFASKNWDHHTVASTGRSTSGLSSTTWTTIKNMPSRQMTIENNHWSTGLYCPDKPKQHFLTWVISKSYALWLLHIAGFLLIFFFMLQHDITWYPTYKSRNVVMLGVGGSESTHTEFSRRVAKKHYAMPRHHHFKLKTTVVYTQIDCVYLHDCSSLKIDCSFNHQHKLTTHFFSSVICQGPSNNLLSTTLVCEMDDLHHLISVMFIWDNWSRIWDYFPWWAIARNFLLLSIGDSAFRMDTIREMWGDVTLFHEENSQWVPAITHLSVQMFK